MFWIFMVLIPAMGIVIGAAGYSKMAKYFNERFSHYGTVACMIAGAGYGIFIDLVIAAFQHSP